MPHNRTLATATPNSAPASEATRLRVLAGTPHSRRGSVLVLVVGVLALLAIIIVVYTSVGQADVRGGRALVNQARLDDQSRAISEHIRSIIGEDATAVRVQRVYTGTGAAGSNYYSTRETSDYPYTDPYYRSNITLGGVNADYARFNPAGNITNGWTAGGEDQRVTSDPYLATTEPTWSNRELNRLPGMPTPFALMGRQRDWGHLSIITPSGLPVNLANLRGRFSAPSGFSPAGGYTQPTDPAMSDWMYLWSRGTGGYNSPSQAVQVAAVGPMNAVEVYNSPATWSNDRLETFRPTTWNPSGLTIGDVKFMGNTLGDADGDGYYDALWQELVDASDPARPTSLLQGGTGVRWFIAPRIIDLSSKVNLNTATGFSVPPDIENPAGITPSDVDLERLLTMVDARQYFGVHPGADWVDGSNYSNPRDITEAGYAAFAGILEARATGLSEVGDNRFADVAGPDIVTPQWLRSVGVQRPTGVTGNGVLLGSVTRRQLYTLGGKDEANGQLRTDSTGTYLKQTGGFGLGDERELRAFGSINDARGIARIETVANSDPRYAFISPFRSLRDFVTDRDAGSLANSNVSEPGDSVPASFAQYFTDVRHLLTTTSGSRPIRYSHKLLASATDPASRYAMTEDDLRVDINPLIRNAVELNPSAAKGIYPLSAANEIFVNYALALSPFLGDPLVWNDATGGKRSLTVSFGGPTYKTATTGTDVGETDTPAFTGRAAEVTTRTAAHLALNLLAWQDNSKANPANTQPDNRPLAATVLLDSTHRSDAASVAYTTGSRAFPYWPASLGGNNRLPTNSVLRSDILGSGKADFKSYAFDLDMGVPAAESRLAGFGGTNTLATGYAINIFAAQPQPFVTAAVSFDMYYDAPIASGGDSPASGSGDRDGEWVVLRDAGGNPIGIQSLGITMRGDVQSTNKDFLLECVAFQVTNPFDVPITLGDTGAGSTFSYYFEFAGKYYDASKYNDAGARVGAVTLAPRQSVCFYVLSDDPVRVQQNWQGADPTISPTAVQDWLNKQLTPLATGQALPFRTVEISPATGTPVAPNAFHDSFNSLATSDSNKVVKLWRAVRQPGAVESAANNDVANDYLVDRLHDPDYGTANRAALYRRLDPGNNRFTTIDAGPEPSEPESQYGPPQENVGYAITFYGSIRRRTDPSGGPLPGATTEATAGVMPAWCMEPKSGAGFTAAANSKNVTEANPGIASTASVTGIGTTDFATGKDFSDRSFKRMVGKGITRAAYTTAGKHPASRDQGNDATNLIGNDLASVGWVAGGKATQLPVYPRRPASPVSPNTEVEKPPLRPADLLLPWAIGPYQNPTLPGATAEIQLELRHTTLSEAIAFGLNYSVSTATDSYEFQIGKALDRGHLPTDRFVPFNDVDANGEWNYARGAADPSISNGVPFALNILDRFRTTRYGTIDSAMPGLININTAPLNVMRMLPLLTPASAHLYADDSLGLKGNWMNDASSAFALKLKDDAGAVTTRSLWKQTDDRWDVAAVLTAYRDKQAVVVRGNQKDEWGASRVYTDFSPRNDGKNVTDADYRGGRAFMTNCVNVRTEPGFKSVGEIMLALVQDDSVRAVGQTLDAVHQKQLGIDRLAAADNVQSPSNFQTPITQISNTNVATLGTLEGTGAARQQAIGLTAQAALRAATVGPGNHFVQGGKTSDYDRKIALADALLNTVSTRSDLFCAYFLVNGYTEGDVQGLEPWTGTGAAPAEDRYTRPMTPSIQRRYMMVLDRSQCTRPGDKPRVLMFEELPVK